MVFNFYSCQELSMSPTSENTNLKFAARDPEAEGVWDKTLLDHNRHIEKGLLCVPLCYEIWALGGHSHILCNLHGGQCNLHQDQCNLHRGPCDLHWGQCDLHQDLCNLHQGQCSLHGGQCNLHQGQCNLCKG